MKSVTRFITISAASGSDQMLNSAKGVIFPKDFPVPPRIKIFEIYLMISGSI